VCGGASVHLYTYPDRSPILTLSTGEVTVTVAMAKTDLDPTAMRSCGSSPTAVTRFAEDCARFTTTADPAAGSAAESRDTPTGPASAAGSAAHPAGRSRASRAA